VLPPNVTIEWPALIISISGSTALYGPRPPLARLLGLAHLWKFGDQPTGCAVQLNPDVTARAIWQAVRRLGWEMAALILLTSTTGSIHACKVLLHAVNLRHGTDGFTSPLKEVVLQIFLSPLKIHRPRSRSNPQTLGPVVSTLTTSPPRSTNGQH
jgi:hypothetical protein